MKRFKRPFKATNKGYDITDTDYNMLGLHKKEVFDNNGDLILIELYTNYNSTNKVFTGLAIQESRIYARNNVSGLPETRISNISWYDVDGNVLYSKNNRIKYYSAKKGFQANKKARTNIVESASMYLFQELLTDNAGDVAATDLQIDDFEAFTTVERSQYINSNIQPLLDKVTNSADINHADHKTYMTEARRDVILGLLNINFIS
jgi:hypothetical protein